LFGFHQRPAAHVLRLLKRRTPRGFPRRNPRRAGSRRARFDPSFARGRLFETTAGQARGFARSSGVGRSGWKPGVTAAREWRRNGLKTLDSRPKMVWPRKPRTPTSEVGARLGRHREEFRSPLASEATTAAPARWGAVASARPQLRLGPRFLRSADASAKGRLGTCEGTTLALWRA
jgi:hypothetical protein